MNCLIILPYSIDLGVIGLTPIDHIRIFRENRAYLNYMFQVGKCIGIAKTQRYLVTAGIHLDEDAAIREQRDVGGVQRGLFLDGQLDDARAG